MTGEYGTSAANEIRFLSLCGLLGYGYPIESLKAGMERGVDFVGVDVGSTDPGPYYLGAGLNFVNPAQVRRDLEEALAAAREAGVPFVIGTAGGAGARPHLEMFLELLHAIADRRGLHFRLATIPADVDADTVVDALRSQRLTPCGGAGDVTEEDIRSCSHLVAQMGTDPIVAALRQGADVVVAGRCCDTAIFAAMPIMRGFDPALALHLGKIAECGTMSAAPGGANDSLLGILRDDHFVVEPANPAKACTPESVAAHSLYEQPDPTCFHEPEGKVDLSGCAFEQVGERSVKVSGTRLIPSGRPSLKIEGAALRGYRTITVAGVCDPATLTHLGALEAGVREAVATNLKGTLEQGDYSLRFLRYGIDAVTGRVAADRTPPPEAGIVIEAIAPTQDLADTVLSLARSTALHQPFPGRKTTAGNLAFPFSPSDFRGGPVYEFAVYHLLEVEDLQEVDDAESLFPVQLTEV